MSAFELFSVLSQFHSPSTALIFLKQLTRLIYNQLSSTLHHLGCLRSDLHVNVALSHRLLAHRGPTNYFSCLFSTATQYSFILTVALLSCKCMSPLGSPKTRQNHGNQGWAVWALLSEPQQAAGSTKLMLGCSVIVMEMNYCSRNVMCVGTTLMKRTEGDLCPNIKQQSWKLKDNWFSILNPLLEFLWLGSPKILILDVTKGKD